MKNLLFILMLLSLVFGCNPTKNAVATNVEKSKLTNNDTVRIANKDLDYEIIIIDNGFNYWLASTAHSRNFYTQNYLEARNQVWVNEWNARVMQPTRYRADLYEMRIDYNNGTNYGYEVNYLLFNYLVYFQLTNNQKLGVFTPRI